MSIEVKKFRAEDMLWVISHGVLEAGLKAQPDDEMKAVAKEREESGKCITGWVDDEIIGVAGIDMLWKGCGDIWLMLTPAIYKNVREGYRCIRDGMKKLIDDNNLRRVQSYGRVDFAACHNHFAHLGFEVEGMAKGYTSDGVDCIMYAKVK